MSIARMNIFQLYRILLDKQISPSDITLELLSGIEQHNPTLNAFLSVSREGPVGPDTFDPERPLDGIPLAVKDNICTLGSKTTCASNMLGNYSSPYEATAVRRLREAGAWIIGKTNLDEFAMGSSTEHSAFGPSRNPWDLERTPGGSSGGSAAAVAAGLVPAALGSDTGGSIRQPAAFCGLVGFKPSYGAVSRYGLVAFASSLDQIGPITRTVGDSARIYNAICGPDPLDGTAHRWAGRVGLSGFSLGLSGITVGILTDFPDGLLDDEVAQHFSEVVNRLKQPSRFVVPVTLPHLKHALACYYIIANAEASANLARYDGLKYGSGGAGGGAVYDTISRNREAGFGEEVKRRILAGTFVLSEGYIDAYYHRAQQVRALIEQDFERAFRTCDVILMPTTPTPAFKLGEKRDRPLDMYRSDSLTVPANLAGLPAISVPSGLSRRGLPFGVQLVGRRFGEATVLRGAAGLERLLNFQEAPPEISPGAAP